MSRFRHFALVSLAFFFLCCIFIHMNPGLVIIIAGIILLFIGLAFQQGQQ